MWIALFLISCTVVDAFRYNYVDSRIYSFAFNGVKPGSFFDGEKLRGTRVELMKEVCCRAAKRCTAAFVSYASCWDENNLSSVLDNRWHDVCSELGHFPRRAATFAFSNISFFDLDSPILAVSKYSNITVADLQNPHNNIKLVFKADSAFKNLIGLELFKKAGFFVQPENLIPIFLNNRSPSDETDEIIKIINDPCVGGQGGLSVGLVSTELIDPKDSFKKLTYLGDPFGPVSLMVRKDEQGILDWWDYTLKRFMCSPDYANFCKRMDQQFGANPANCPDPSQVDCSDCTRPHRVPGCDCPAQ